MNKKTIRNLILAFLLLGGIGTILTAARDNMPSQEVMVAVVSGEISEDEANAGQLPDATQENDNFYRVIDAEDDEDDEDAREEVGEDDGFSFADLFSFIDDEDDDS